MNRVKIFTARSPELDINLVAIQKLARQVFEPEVPEIQYDVSPPKSAQLQLDNWRERLSADNAAILYVTAEPDLSVSQSASSSTAPIVGFFFVNPRPLSDTQQSLHIYLAAVHPSARGQGIFSMLLAETRRMAKAAAFQILTVSTIPERFPRMYDILSNAGSGWEVVSWEDLADREGRKVVMKMIID